MKAVEIAREKCVARFEGFGGSGTLYLDVVVYEYDDKTRIVSFGSPWEYGSYIYDYPKPGYTEDQIGGSPPPDQADRDFCLDMGSTGRRVWLERDEARRIFGWARPFLTEV